MTFYQVYKDHFSEGLYVCAKCENPLFERSVYCMSIVIFEMYQSQHLVILQNQAQLDNIILTIIFLLGIIILMIIFSFILVGPSMNMPHHGQLSPKPSSK